MNYYVTVIQITNSGESAQAVNKYSTLDAALASLHQEMAYGINAKLNGVTCVIIDERGAIHKTDSWTNPDRPVL